MYSPFYEFSYSGELLDASKLSQALKGGPKSPGYTALISWLVNQISSFETLNESVHPISSPEDFKSFLMETSSLLKELGCMNQRLTTGNIEQRLIDMEDKIYLIEYLISELMASAMLEAKKSEQSKVSNDRSSNAMVRKL